MPTQQAELSVDDQLQNAHDALNTLLLCAIYHKNHGNNMLLCINEYSGKSRLVRETLRMIQAPESVKSSVETFLLEVGNVVEMGQKSAMSISELENLAKMAEDYFRGRGAKLSSVV